MCFGLVPLCRMNFLQQQKVGAFPLSMIRHRLQLSLTLLHLKINHPLHPPSPSPDNTQLGFMNSLAPFPTVTDGVTSGHSKARVARIIIGTVRGSSVVDGGFYSGGVHRVLRGAPAGGAVTTAPADQLVDDM